MPGTYICDAHAEECPHGIPDSMGARHGHCYHESTRRRLDWQHGENRIDHADIARWNALGSRQAVAA
jgi:hypothetical protein